MAATGSTPISHYYTTNAGSTPTAGNLVNGELAINIHTSEGKLFYKDSAGTVQLIASKATGTVAGSTTQVIYNNAGAYAGSANMTFDGSTLTTLNLAYNGTLTGGTGVVNLGLGQFYKAANGNVGIGTSSPGAKLAVGSTASPRGGANTFVIVSNSSAASTCYSEIQSATDGNGGIMFSDGSTGNYGLINYIHTSDALQLYTAGAERMRILSGGQVCVGATSSAGSTGSIYSAISGGSNLLLEKSTGGSIALYQSGVLTTLIEDVNAQGGLRISTGTGGSVVENFRISSTGLLSFNSGYGASAPAYGCRAWVNFNGTGTIAITGSANISSIADIAVGNYRVNMITAMPDQAYSVQGMAGNGGFDAGILEGGPNGTSQVYIYSFNKSANTADFTQVQFSIFR